MRNRRRVSDSDNFDGDMRSPPSQARSSLAFVPERDANRKVAWEETSPTRAGSNTSRSKRQQHDRRGRNADPLPSNFSRKLKDMRDGAREEEEAPREAYEDETKRGGPVRRPVSPRKNVEKYVSGVRDAFIRPETKRPSTAPEGRTRRVTSKPTTARPFAGLEARATIQRKSTSFRKMEEDPRKKREAEEANLRYRFKPVPIPKSTREKRYQASSIRRKPFVSRGRSAEGAPCRHDRFRGHGNARSGEARKEKRREERKAAARRKKEDEDEAKRIQKIKKQRAAAAAMRAAEEHRAQEVLRRARMAKRAEDQLRHSKAPSRMAEFEKVKGQKAMEKARRAELKRAADERRRKAKSKVLGPEIFAPHLRKSMSQRRMQQGRMTKAPTREPFAFMSEDRMREEQREGR